MLRLFFFNRNVIFASKISDISLRARLLVILRVLHSNFTIYTHVDEIDACADRARRRLRSEQRGKARLTEQRSAAPSLEDSSVLPPFLRRICSLYRQSQAEKSHEDSPSSGFNFLQILGRDRSRLSYHAAT